MIFTAGDNHMLLPAQDFPAGINSYPVLGSQANAFLNEDGYVILQELKSSCCTVKHFVLKMNRPEEIRIHDKSPLLFICIALQQDFKFHIEGLGNVTILEGQYNLIYTPNYNQVLSLKRGREYIYLGLYYQFSVLEEMTAYFNGLDKFLKKVKLGQPTILHINNSWITRDIQDSVYHILHSQVDINEYPLFIDLTTKTLLFHLMIQTENSQPPSRFTHYETEGIYAARDIIRKNIRYHFVIRDIAKKVGLNEAKLKIGFKEIFGNGVYEYLHSERMIEARHLLFDQSRSIKEIASLTGYKSVNSFIKAFKKQYRQTPGEFRRRA